MMEYWLESYPNFTFTGMESCSNKEKIRIVTWNVLADVYSQPKSFPRTDPVHLSWGARFPVLKQRLWEIHADIICLQEVDHLKEWAQEITAHGMEILIKKRPGRKDGCILAWKKNKFDLLHSLTVDFDKLVPPSCGNLSRRFRKSNVGIIAVLEVTIYKIQVQRSPPPCCP
mmetsp:Transcript_24098/g.39925  ORF Transcript_24098/g.39925 Transcript_24098/m.39925 type:complete len:171 (-) Transcript_24098:57-569(-)